MHITECHLSVMLYRREPLTPTSAVHRITARYHNTLTEHCTQVGYKSLAVTIDIGTFCCYLQTKRLSARNMIYFTRNVDDWGFEQYVCNRAFNLCVTLYISLFSLLNRKPGINLNRVHISH